MGKEKSFVLSGYYGFKNFGDEAILSVLISKLQEYNHKITVISSDTEYTKSKFKNIESIYTFKLSKIFNAVLNSDYLISGGGSLLQDATSLKSLIYYLLIIFIGLFLRKKVIIFAQGIGPIYNSFGKFLTKTLLKHCSYISVRDDKSLKLINSWGINADLVCDPVFSAQISPHEKTNTVAIQLRNFKTMNKDFLDRLAQAVSSEFSDKNIEIYSFQKEIDLEICKQFEASLNLLNPEIKTTLYSELSDEEIITNLSKCEYMLGMRFHALIIALLTKTKTLAINYDIKVEKLASEFNIPIIDLKNDFGNNFKKLKNFDINNLTEIVKDKKFDWSGFENIINL